MATFEAMHAEADKLRQQFSFENLLNRPYLPAALELVRADGWAGQATATGDLDHPSLSIEVSHEVDAELILQLAGVPYTHKLHLKADEDGSSTLSGNYATSYIKVASDADPTAPSIEVARWSNFGQMLTIAPEVKARSEENISRIVRRTEAPIANLDAIVAGRDQAVWDTVSRVQERRAKTVAKAATAASAGL